MPTQCACRVWPWGGRGLQGPFLSPGVLSTAAAPPFFELLLLGWHLPLPTSGTQPSPTPIPEPMELETTCLENAGEGQPSLDFPYGESDYL